MEQSMETLVIDIQSKTSGATQSIGKLISSLKNLQKELENTVNKSSGLSSLKNIGTSVGKKATGISQNIPRDKTTALKNVGIQESNLGELQSRSAVQGVKDILKVTETYKNSQGQTIKLIKTSKDNFESYSASVKQTANSMEKLKKVTNLMNSAKTKLIGILGGFGIGLKTIPEYFESASAEAEALNLYVVSLGQNAQKGSKWVKEFSDALYLDPTAVMQYMGSFNSLIEGLGVGSDNAYKMSKNLTQLVYDLSSFKNISIESAYEKLMSGISGKIICLVRKGLRTVTHLIQWKSKHVMV